MTSSRIEKLFQKNNKIVYSLAWKFHQQYGIALDDAQSEAMFLFLQASKKWPGERTVRFSTWAHKCIYNGMIDMLRKKIREDKIQRIPIETEETISIENKEVDASRTLQFKDELEQLSQEAKYVVSIILDGLVDYKHFKFHPSPKAVRGFLWSHLKKQKWSIRQVRQVFNEIKEVVA